MFTNMKIGTRLGLGFGLVLMLLVVIAIVGITRLNQLNEDVEKIVTDKYPKTEMANDILAEVSQIGLSSRNMIIMDKREQLDKQLETIEESRKIIKDRLEKLEAVVKSDKGKDLLAKVKDTRSSYVTATDHFLKLVADGRSGEAKLYLLEEARPKQLSYTKVVKDLIDYQSDLMNSTGKEAIETYQNARTVMIMLALLATVFAVGVAFWVSLSITRPLSQAVGIANQLAEGNLITKINIASKDETGQLLAALKNMVEKLTQIISQVRSSADALSSASEEVSATAQSLSQASSEQSASVEETSASVEEMTASINQNSENSKVTDGMASKASKEAVEGGESVKQTVSAMKSIADKIGIIDDIAYQTNLLALNAAIEAARAGEHGKGFAVVAAEVRKLAERSQVAAQEIGEVAKSSVGLAERAGTLLDEIVPSIKKTSDLVQEIAAASEEQSSGVGQINTAMSQLNQLTQQNASSSEELAATAEEMSGQAEQLQQLMSFFKLEIQSAAQVFEFAKNKPKPHIRQMTSGRNRPAKVANGVTSEDEFVKF